MTETEFNSDIIKKNGLSHDPLFGTQDSIIFEQSNNHSLQIKPLGDINIKLEDIIPCMYKNCIYLNFKIKYYMNIKSL